MRRALVLVAFLSSVGAASAQELGRLFFTEEQRAALDARRKARTPDRPAAPAAVTSPSTRVDGYVRRSGGPSTVWVNGETLGVEGTDAPRIESGRREGRVSVPVGDGPVRFSLKPGQVLDRSTGEIRDVLGNGEVQVPARP
ncbi:MAG TPA: hypothetical protein VGP97_05175 [Burkholderiales bacterium]|jgi:hypothetical protein|nr:hypothetical protein [Burkholderiales bacterium]